MTSKNSTNKNTRFLNREGSFRALLRNDLRHRSWMLALSLLGSFLASPTAFLLANNGLARIPRHLLYLPESFLLDEGGAVNAQEVALYNFQNILEYLHTGHLLFQLALLLLCALLAAWFGFRHLYSRRMTDLYHSAPLSRDRLFLVKWLGGFLTWFAPFLLGNLCVWLMALYKIGSPAYWGQTTLALLKIMLLCALFFLIAYNACLVPVMLSGNAVNALVNMLLYGLIVLAGNFTVLAYVSYYLHTSCAATAFDEALLHPLAVSLSPLASPIVLAILLLKETSLAKFWRILILSLLFQAADFRLALLLHRKRPSELAQRGVENKYFRTVMRFAASALAGLLLALLFDMSYGLGTWVLFGALLGSILIFALLNILYHAGFPFFLCHKRQLLLCVLLICGTIGIFRYDLFGYDSYLPREEDIVGLSLYSDMLSDASYTLDTEGEPRVIFPFRREPSPHFLCTDSAAVHHLLETVVHPQEYRGDVEYTRLYVRVYTRHGSYRRQYRIRNTAEVRDALRPITESDAYRECFYPASAESFPLPYCVNLRSLDNADLTILEGERIRELHEAYRQDFLEHYAGSVSSLRYSPLCLKYTYAEFEDDLASYIHAAYNTVNLYFSEDYARTIALLENWYPDQLWSTKGMKPESLSVSIFPAAGTTGAFYETLGIAPDVSDSADFLQPRYTSREVDAEVYSRYFSSGASYLMPYYWGKQVSSPEELEQWRPYLVLCPQLSFFQNKEYVRVGVATMSLGERKSYTMNCYVEKGRLPSELLDGMESITRN